MQVIVLHKRQLSETETDIDICICGNIRISFLPIPSPVPIFTPSLFSLSINVAAETLKRNFLYRCSLF